MKRTYVVKVIFVLAVAFLLSSSAFVLEETQEDRLLQIAKEYGAYSRYDITTPADSALKWTIILCRPVTPEDYIQRGIELKVDSLHVSKPLASSGPHGNKLYKFFVKDIASYDPPALLLQPDGRRIPQPNGQVLVKETWNVREVDNDKVSQASIPVKRSMNDGKWYTPTTVSELFIMYKEPKSEKNDEGWVYGIVNMEDTTHQPRVLENGKISSCIGCHSGTKYDRIFGVK